MKTVWHEIWKKKSTGFTQSLTPAGSSSRSRRKISPKREALRETRLWRGISSPSGWHGGTSWEGAQRTWRRSCEKNRRRIETLVSAVSASSKLTRWRPASRIRGEGRGAEREGGSPRQEDCLHAGEEDDEEEEEEEEKCWQNTPSKTALFKQLLQRHCFQRMTCCACASGRSIDWEKFSERAKSLFFWEEFFKEKIYKGRKLLNEFGYFFFFRKRRKTFFWLKRFLL